MKRGDSGATPLRALHPPAGHLPTPLGGLTAATLRDARAEVAPLLRLLDRLTDRASASETLAVEARNLGGRQRWAPERANLLRPLDLPTGLRVLVVGGGPLARYLGERAALVDAVEGAPADALVVASHCQDLDSTRVFVGSLDDLPDGPAYDLVMADRPFERVRAGHQPATVVEGLARLLRPGGRLLISADNRFGVRYLAGAPDQQRGQRWAPLERAHAGGAALGRHGLEAALARPGHRVRLLGVMPDVVFPRLLFADALLAARPALAWQVPQMPSPDWGGAPLGREASEALVWQSLVDEGLGAATVNGWLCLVEAEDAKSLWPDSALAAYYPAVGRRPSAWHETRLVIDGEALRFERRPLGVGPEDRPTTHPTLTDQSLVDGTDLLQLMATTPDQEPLRELLRHWTDLVRSQAPADGGDAPVDLLPHNIVVDGDGDLQVVDDKWRAEGYGADEIIERGVFTIATRLCGLTEPERWPGHSVGDLVRYLGALCGLDADGEWLPAALERESLLQASVSVMTSEEILRQYRTLVDLPRSAVGGHRAAPTFAAAAELAEAVADLRNALGAAEARAAHGEHFLVAAREQVAILTEEVAARDRSLAKAQELLEQSEERARRAEARATQVEESAAFRLERRLTRRR